MVQSVRSRIRLFIGVLGCAVLGTSFLSWAHSLNTAADQYIWVRLDPSRARPAEAAELWQVSASCARPYFVRALLRSKAKLEAHYNAAPPEVRARLNQRPAPGQSVEPAAWHPPESVGQQIGRSDPYGEYVAALQVKYAEWYAALFKLEIEAGKWQQRLLHAADQTVVVSAASRTSFGAYSRGVMELTGSEGDFDGHLLNTLGLGGFSGDEQASLKSACVTINPVMQRLQAPGFLGELWRWPLDCLAEFSCGVELVLIAIFFAPILLWLETGDLKVVTRRIRVLADRLGSSVRDFNRGKPFGGLLERVRQMLLTVFATPDRTKPYAACRRASDAMAGTAKPEQGRPSLRPFRPHRPQHWASRQR